MNTGTQHIGFIGLGVMGKPMAERLFAVYPHFHVYARRKETAAAFSAKGASVHDSPAALAAACSVIITMVGFPADVEEVYLGEHGIFSTAPAGTLCIDMTTSSPLLAKRIAEEGFKRGIRVLDAPVSGGDIGAQNGTLSIMCGGNADAFAQAEPFFRCIGKTWTLLGSAGSGQHAKAANQIAVAANLIGTVEALKYAQTAGLSPHTVLDAINGGAAASWQLSNNGPKMLAGDYSPGFFVKHFLKDLSIALESAQSLDRELPGLRLAHTFFTKMAEADYNELGTQALYRYYGCIQ